MGLFFHSRRQERQTFLPVLIFPSKPNQSIVSEDKDREGKDMGDTEQKNRSGKQNSMNVVFKTT